MRRAHAEDVGEDGDVGGEGEVVVGYSQGHGQALDRLIAKQAFTSTAMREGWGAGARQDGIRQNTTGTEREKKKESRCKFYLPCMACSGRNISLQHFLHSTGQ